MARLKKDKRFQLFTANGTMEEKLNELIIKSGLPFDREDKRKVDEEILGSSNFSHINFVRPHNIPDFVNSDKLHTGLTGLDMLIEFLCRENLRWNKFHIEAVLDVSGKSDMKAADILIAAKKGSAFDPDIIRKKRSKGIEVKGLTNGIIDRKDVLVQAEYPNIAKRIFKHAKIIFSHGSTEQVISKGWGKYGVFLRDQGGSIKSNNLVVAKELFSTPMILLAQRKHKVIRNLGERLMGVLYAKQRVDIKMHAQGANLEKIIKNLPSMRLPTVIKLGAEKPVENDSCWYALTTIVKRTEIRELQMKLEDLGAIDFVESGPEVIVKPLVIEIEKLFPTLLFPELQKNEKLKM